MYSFRNQYNINKDTARDEALTRSRIFPRIDHNKHEYVDFARNNQQQNTSPRPICQGTQNYLATEGKTAKNVSACAQNDFEKDVKVTKSISTGKEKPIPKETKAAKSNTTVTGKDSAIGSKASESTSTGTQTNFVTKGRKVRESVSNLIYRSESDIRNDDIGSKNIRLSVKGPGAKEVIYPRIYDSLSSLDASRSELFGPSAKQSFHSRSGISTTQPSAASSITSMKNSSIYLKDKTSENHMEKISKCTLGKDKGTAKDENKITSELDKSQTGIVAPSTKSSNVYVKEKTMKKLEGNSSKQSLSPKKETEKRENLRDELNASQSELICSSEKSSGLYLNDSAIRKVEKTPSIRYLIPKGDMETRQNVMQKTQNSRGRLTKPRLFFAGRDELPTSKNSSKTPSEI